MFFSSHKSCEPKITYTVITDVTTEILSIDLVKRFMQIDFPDFDDDIADIFIKGTRPEIEKYTGLSLGERKIQLAGDWQKEGIYMPFEPIISTSSTGEQVVGYTTETLPGDLQMAWLNMIHIAFEFRTTGLNYATGLKLLDRSRRRAGL